MFFRKKNNSCFAKIVVRTAKALIIVSEYPNKHININLQPYKSKEEVLKDTDIDSLAGKLDKQPFSRINFTSLVCYDGTDVFSSPRFIRALATRHLVVRVPEDKSEISSEKNGYVFKQMPDKVFRMNQLGFNIVVPGTKH